MLRLALKSEAQTRKKEPLLGPQRLVSDLGTVVAESQLHMHFVIPHTPHSGKW